MKQKYIYSNWFLKTSKSYRYCLFDIFFVNPIQINFFQLTSWVLAGVDKNTPTKFNSKCPEIIKNSKVKYKLHKIRKKITFAYFLAEVFFTSYMRTSQMLSKLIVSGNVIKYILVLQSNYVFFSEYVCMIKTKLLNCSSLKRIAAVDHITMLWREKISIYLLLGFNILEMQQVFSRKWRKLFLICFFFFYTKIYDSQHSRGRGRLSV